MNNPYKLYSDNWANWEYREREYKRNDKMIEDMGKLIAENITKITYNEKGYLEVEIVISDTSKYTKEQKEHHIFIKDMTQTICVDGEQFLEWRKLNQKFI